MIKDNEFEQIILEIVGENNGIKSVDLALKTMNKINPLRFDSIDFHSVLDSLVKRDKITELNYIVPGMEYRIKSIYFPRETRFLVRKSSLLRAGEK